MKRNTGITRRVRSVDPAAMKLVAALMDDPNPIHWDEQAVMALGLGNRPVNQGPVTVSYLLDLAAQVAGGASRVAHFKARFLDNLFAGERVDCVAQFCPHSTSPRRLLLSASVGERRVVEAIAVLRDG